MAEDKASPKTATKKAAKPAAKKAVVKKAAAKPAAAKPAAKAESKSTVRKVSITLIRSKNGRLASHKACVAGLGLRRIRHTVTVNDTPENRGMINKISYMVAVEEV